MSPGRTALVTGASRGIGRAIAQRFAADGVRVIAVGRDERALEETAAAASAAAEIAVATCDVSDEAAVTALFEEFDVVDVLVCNAGLAETAPAHRTSLADWERHLAVNATGVFLCIRAALASMRERDYGRIITVASTAGRVGQRYTAAYSASKHAAIGLTRAVAAEVAGTGITANAVCPTFVRTDLTARSIERITELTGRGEEEAQRLLEESSPLGRLLEPDEVAAAVRYLASDAAAAVNGQSLVIDGGGLQA